VPPDHWPTQVPSGLLLKVGPARRIAEWTAPRAHERPMSTDPKPKKPVPSLAEINAYLELSAARTKLRLPLAKGATSVGRPQPASATDGSSVPAAEKSANPALPLQTTKRLPTQAPGPTANSFKGAQSAAPSENEADASSNEAWRPFSIDEEG
jgi:hypothetical protein